MGCGSDVAGGTPAGLDGGFVSLGGRTFARYERQVGLRLTHKLLNLSSAFLIFVGFLLVSSFFLAPIFISQPSPVGTITPSDVQEGVAPSETPTPNDANAGAEEPAPEQASARAEEVSSNATANVPQDKTLRLTVPKMGRIRDAVVPYAVGTDENALRDSAGIHLAGTGFPWEENANVYIAGHRMGYPFTDSYLAFYDLHNVEVGDEVKLTDANGTEYSYRVFKTLTAEPSDSFLTLPVPGKNVVTLQTCTLPDYSDRLIVQAERVA